MQVRLRVRVTLILSAHKRDTVFQVGDRMVSQVFGRKMSTLDVMTNKTVVYQASDGVMCIGVSGRAFLENRRVDLWLAETLTGTELGEEGSIVFLAESAEPMNVFDVAQLVKEEAERVFRRIRLQRHTDHGFVFAGWQRRRRNEAQPFLWRLENTRDHPELFVFSNLLKGAKDWLHLMSFTPLGSFRSKAMTDLQQTLRGPHSRDSFEADLVSAIRSEAEALPGIGKDCLAVQLRPDVTPSVRIRFVPRVEPRIMQIGKAAARRVLPFVFSPWIIGRGTLMPPNLILGMTGQMAIGGLTCGFDTPKTDDAAAYGMSMHSVADIRRAVYEPRNSKSD